MGQTEINEYPSEVLPETGYFEITNPETKELLAAFLYSPTSVTRRTALRRTRNFAAWWPKQNLRG